MNYQTLLLVDTLNPWIIVGMVLGTLALIGLGILFYFTAFAHMRMKKQVREINRKFEYLHALLFGQDSQYIKRIEIISRTNILYLDIHMNFNKRFKEIRDSGDSSMQEEVNRIRDYLNEHNYKELKLDLPNVKAKLAEFEEKVNSLNDDLLAVIRPEEECRQQSLVLKENLRQIKQDYYIKQADLSLVSASFEKVFRLLDDRFSAFESYVESAQYDEANNLLPSIASVIKELGKDLQILPNLCITIQTVIPEKINSLENRYGDMIEAGYPLHHIMGKERITEMREELVAAIKAVREFSLNGVPEALDGISAEIEDYFESFEREKEARVTFDSECDAIYVEESNVEQKNIRLCNALPDVKKIYALAEEEQAKVDYIKTLINKASATKRSLDTFIHSGTKQPYSLLVEKMHSLQDEASEANNAIDEFDKYLFSLKADSEAAMKAVAIYYESLQNIEVTLRKIDVPALVEAVTPKIDELFQIIDEIYSRLYTRPIDVAAINAKVDVLHHDGDELAKYMQSQYEMMLKADAAIVYANRRRADFGQLNAILLQTEKLYFSADFANSYADTTAAIKRLRGVNE